LFKQFYPRATTSSQPFTYSAELEVTNFEFATAEPLVGKHESTSQPGPKQGGIFCNIYGMIGAYKGQLFLVNSGSSRPTTRDRGSYKEWLIKPYSPKRDMHLSVVLKYPPDVSEDFLKEFHAIMEEFVNSSP